jgi:hypothetical protein
MPNDKKMPMAEAPDLSTSGPAPTSGKQDETRIAESVLPKGARVERETARSEMGGKADKWRGAGDYYYEVTSDGIRVTGGDKAKTLTGGKSTTLSWNDTDPKTMEMIHAILASRTDKDSELGSTYSAPEEGRELDMNPGRALEAATASDPKLAAMLEGRADPTFDDKRFDVARRAMERHGYSEED